MSFNDQRSPKSISASPAKKKRRFTGDHSWSNHSLCLFSSYEGEACHEKYDTKADANDAAVAARAWLRGHSPFPLKLLQAFHVRHFGCDAFPDFAGVTCPWVPAVPRGGGGCGWGDTHSQCHVYSLTVLTSCSYTRNKHSKRRKIPWKKNPGIMITLTHTQIHSKALFH